MLAGHTKSLKLDVDYKVMVPFQLMMMMMIIIIIIIIIIINSVVPLGT